MTCKFSTEALTVMNEITTLHLGPHARYSATRAAGIDILHHKLLMYTLISAKLDYSQPWLVPGPMTVVVTRQNEEQIFCRSECPTSGQTLNTLK
jgi:hypothetical protein